MAKLSEQHGKVTEIWISNIEDDIRYHVTDKGIVLRVLGKEGNKAMVVRKAEDGSIQVGRYRPRNEPFANIQTDPLVREWLIDRASQIKYMKEKA